MNCFFFSHGFSIDYSVRKTKFKFSWKVLLWVNIHPLTIYTWIKISEKKYSKYFILATRRVYWQPQHWEMFWGQKICQKYFPSVIQYPMWWKHCLMRYAIKHKIQRLIDVIISKNGLNHMPNLEMLSHLKICNKPYMYE